MPLPLLCLGLALPPLQAPLRRSLPQLRPPWPAAVQRQLLEVLQLLILLETVVHCLLLEVPLGPLPLGPNLRLLP